MTRNEIKKMIESRGVNEPLVSTCDLANAIGVSRRTIQLANTSGELKQYDRGAFELTAVLDWLERNPRFLVKKGQQKREITVEMLDHIVKVIKMKWQIFADQYGEEDLAHEVLVRLSKKTPSKRTEFTEINYILMEMWDKHKKSIETISLDELKEKGFGV